MSRREEMIAELKDQFNGKLLVDFKDIAAFMGISVHTIYKRRTEGTMPFPVIKDGRNCRVSIFDLADFLTR